MFWFKKKQREIIELNVNCVSHDYFTTLDGKTIRVELIKDRTRPSGFVYCVFRSNIVLGKVSYEGILMPDIGNFIQKRALKDLIEFHHLRG